MTDRSFGGWLKYQRKTRGLTQEQLASQVNCSASALRKLESDTRRPSVQLAELFAKIFMIPANEQIVFLKFARGDWLPPSGKFIEEAPWRILLSPRSNLPSPPNSLIGREQEVADVRGYLLKPDIRLVTLIGPPGIGKTRLSLEVAHEISSHFPDGVFFVALAPLDDPLLIAPSIVQALGYMETKDFSALEQVMDGIGHQQILILLDNIEHLIDDGAPLVSRLLSACPRLNILVTSRESLRVSGEWLYPVPTLPIPTENSIITMETVSEFPALKLFAERARAVRSDFTLNSENIQVVASICAQLDGLPLAIELIANRIRLMSPKLLLEHMNDQFVLSADGMRPDSARQKTLGNAISWSYRSLSPEEQSLFTCLSVFPESFSLQAAEKIFAGKFQNQIIAHLITSLSDKSLLQRITDMHGETRFTMLVTIQKFALERLRQVDGEHEIRDSHLAYFLALAEQADKEIHSADQLAWMDHLNHELDNFRSALSWCLSTNRTLETLRLFTALAWTWNVRWSRNEARSWFYKIRVMPDIDKYPEDYAKLLNSAGLREWRMGNYTEARSVLEESLELWQKLGYKGELGQAMSLVTLGMVTRWGEKDIDKAESYFNQSLALFQKYEDEWGIAWNLFHLGITAGDRDQNESALAFFNQSLELYNELGDPWGLARVSQFLGLHYLKRDEYKKAHFYFDQHLKHDESLRFMDGVSVALCNFGELYRLQGDYAQAKKHYEKSLAISREHGMKPDIGVNLYNLGLLALQQNDYPEAPHYFTESFEATRTVHEKISAHHLFIGLSAVAGGMSQPERSAKLAGAAQALFETTDSLLSAFDRAEIDRHIQVARQQLGNILFEEFITEGRTMPIEQAIIYALENSRS